MAYLELDEILSPTRPFFERFRIQPVRDLAHLLRGLERGASPAEDAGANRAGQGAER